MARAVLVAKCTSDGLIEVRDEVPLGKIYDVDLSTRQYQHGIHLPSRYRWSREMVKTTSTNEWLPVELLQIES